jgi:phosphoribosylaminoimidazole-succinocarboxamide synthase
LLGHFPEPEILLDKNRMDERSALAKDNALPESVMMAVSNTYVSLAEKITGQILEISDNPKAEIIAVLREKYDLVD